MKVIENFLPAQEFNTLKSVMTGSSFPWFLYKGVVGDDDYYQFCHTFYRHLRPNTSEHHLSIINPILEKLNVVSLLRIKANLLYKTNKIIKHGYHTDFEPDLNNKTSIFYVNTNNGYTSFKNGRKVKSKENTLVEFDSKLEHSGTTCTDKEYRMIINFNYYKKKK